MEGDRGLKLSSGSLAKRSMSFLRDAYALASQHATSPSTNSFSPSQGLSPHFSQSSQHLRPYAPAHSSSWPGPGAHQNQSTANLGAPSQPYSPQHQPQHQQFQTSISGQQQQYVHPLPPPPPPSQSHSPPSVSPASPAPNLSPSRPALLHEPPPPYHLNQPSHGSTPMPVHQRPGRSASQQQRPLPPLPVFSPDDYQEIQHSEIASVRPALPPRPSTASPQLQQTWQAPPPQQQRQQRQQQQQQQYQAPYQQQHSYQASVPSQQQHQMPPTLQTQHQALPPPQQPVYHQSQQSSPVQFQSSGPPQQYTQQSPLLTNSPSNFHQPQDFVPYRPVSPSGGPPNPPHAQTWPQNQHAFTQPPQHHQHGAYFDHRPPPSNVYEVPAVSISPPIAELPTPSPVQTQPQQQYTYHQQSQVGTHQQGQYQAYQPFPGAVGDVKPAFQTQNASMPAGIAELPG